MAESDKNESHTLETDLIVLSIARKIIFWALLALFALKNDDMLHDQYKHAHAGRQMR